VRGANQRKTVRARHLRRNLTDAEKRLWYRLNNRALGGWKFVRQEPIGSYIADFVCRECKLLVELDGSQHAESKRDQVRDAYLGSIGYRVLRFWNHEVAENLDGVLLAIFAALGGEHGLSPLPAVRGEGCIGGPADAASPKGEGEGASPGVLHPEAPPHPRFARFVPAKGDEALSPHAGRGEGGATRPPPPGGR
jgi:very-short-patch-repair endonuclease